MNRLFAPNQQKGFPTPLSLKESRTERIAAKHRIAGFALSAAIFAALLSAQAFAAKKSANVNFALSATAGSSELAPGDYHITWEGTGPAVQVTLKKDGKSTTVPAQLVEGRHEDDGSVVTNMVGGVRVLQEIDFSHFSLVFNPPAPAKSGNASGN